ncbi:MAG: twitching motility protein PilT [Chloroflexaceae bacterium]|nr:twitching motility protein PilT [Chloroflexaceae bacterium]
MVPFEFDSVEYFTKDGIRRDIAGITTDDDHSLCTEKQHLVEHALAGHERASIVVEDAPLCVALFLAQPLRDPETHNVAGVLMTFPLKALPASLGNYLPLIVTLMLTYIGAMIFALHKRSVASIERGVNRLRLPTTALASPDALPSGPSLRHYLLDTSAIIDGRIAMIGTTGFLEGTLLVPQFVLIELQMLADSSDDLRRSKGRRGLDLLNQMQKDSSLPVEVIDVDVSGMVRVDDKLVMVARQYQCPIITNDFNLNRVAELQGVKVLSLNKLSDALRPPVVQDQHLQILIRNEGNARQQGVGYLDDGTPVIIEDARHLIGKQVHVVVTRLHQTQTGRLVFANLMDEG